LSSSCYWHGKYESVYGMANSSIADTKVPTSSANSLFDDLGLAWPQSGSLGWRFAGTLAIGAAIGAVIGLQTPDPVATGWVVFASLLLWQPFIEELLFRGLIQGYLARTESGARTRAGISLANIATSCVFVLAHLVNQPPAWALAVFFPSLLFGYFRDRTVSIWPSLLLHASFNAAFFLP
jgi:membrane protease YdiL (CAAX protease family)